MGKVTRAGQYVEGADAALVDILERAAAASGYDVEFKSGYRAGDPRQHGKKNAIDVTLIDPKTGQRIPDYQNASSFRTYEEFAQAARQIQRRDYPELDSKFRWGGYFSSKKGLKGYGAIDLMHFDLAGDKMGMVAGSWENGLTQAARDAYPGIESVGFNDHPVPRGGLLDEVRPETMSPRIAGIRTPPIPATSYNLDDLRRRNAIGTAPRPRMQSEAMLAQRSGLPPLPRPAPAAPASIVPSARAASLQGGMLGSPIGQGGVGYTPNVRQAEEAYATNQIPLPAGLEYQRNIGGYGFGSLLGYGPSPATPNPRQTTVAGRPSVPIGSMPAARPTAPLPPALNAVRPEMPGALPAAPQRPSNSTWGTSFNAAINAQPTSQQTAGTTVLRKDGSIVPIPRAGTTAMPAGAVPQFITKTIPNPAYSAVKAVDPSQIVRTNSMGIPTGQVGVAAPSTPRPPVPRTITVQVPNPQYVPIPAPITQRPVIVPPGTPVRPAAAPAKKRSNGLTAAQRGTNTSISGPG